MYMKRIAAIVFVLFAILVQTYSQQITRPSQQALDSIKKLTNLDRQNMMSQLSITAIRSGVSGDAKAPNAANYDETKAFPFNDIPLLMLLKNGKKVTTADTWWKKRRPEIMKDFDNEIYGIVPSNTPKVNWEIIKTIQDTIGGIPVITKSLLGHVENSNCPTIIVDINLTLTTPANISNPVPVILEFSWFIPTKEMLTPKEGNSEKSWQQQVLEKGWGFAYMIPTSIQADNGAGLREGIIGLINKGQFRKPNDWGALKAWAWGASRVLDYFETIKTVDSKRVGITGHSRYGKAALVCMAYDERFAVSFITSSGEGGAKLHRHFAGEVVENIASSGAYHWMAGNFLKYASILTTNDLPVDSHELIALCAPRPVFISNGDKGDSWADPNGMFLAAVYAGPAYELLGKKGLGTDVIPPVETSIMDGELAFRQHPGGHTAGPNWPFFLDFAYRYLKVK